MSHADEILGLLPARRGHFLLESGHHADLWLDLELLCYRAEPVRRLANRLAEALSPHEVEVVCGPLIEGAFVGLIVASALDVPFAYSTPSTEPGRDGLFPVRYQIPRGLRHLLQGRRVAVVNDITNAGSAVRGTLADLRACGAVPAAIGTLAALGGAAADLARHEGIPLETLATVPNNLWTPSQCPLCAQQVPLEQRS